MAVTLLFHFQSSRSYNILAEMNPKKLVEGKKLKVVIIGEFKREIYQTFALILKKHMDIKEWYLLKDFNNPPPLAKRWISTLIEFREIIKKFNPDKLLICGGSLASIWIIIIYAKKFCPQIEIIAFRYDIEYFRPYPKRHLEKFTFLMSDKIIHKGVRNELKLLPFYNKIYKKPHYLFREFLNKENIQKFNPNKLSKKDKEMHLVYVGNIYTEDLPYADSIWTFYPKIIKQKLHLHVYSKIDKKTQIEFKKISSKEKYFHYGGNLPHEALIKHISKYDYGIYSLHTWNRVKVKNDYFVSTSFGNKTFDYILSHLPVLCAADAKATADFIKSNGIGIIINDQEVSKLHEILVKNEKNYYLMVKNIDNSIIKLIDDSGFIKFVEF